MRELLTESTFSLNEMHKDSIGNGKHRLLVVQYWKDGLAETGESHHFVELTDYGLDSLERNLKTLLSVIKAYKEKPRRIEEKAIPFDALAQTIMKNLGRIKPEDE